MGLRKKSLKDKMQHIKAMTPDPLWTTKFRPLVFSFVVNEFYHLPT